MLADLVAASGLAIWLYLIFARGSFWLAPERDDWPLVNPAEWPRVIAVVPARNEAASIGETVDSLLRQDYPGNFRVVVVDDDSSDGTGEAAGRAAAAAGAAQRLTVVQAKPLPEGWTGKLWAVKQGIDVAEAGPQPPQYLLLTDADIAYRPGVLMRLVAHAEAEGLALLSLMAKLRCETLAERFHVPAFIFFFQMLYPFSWVNDKEQETAAAAGGCMLVRGGALRAIGGVASIRDALIDDCALARKLKTQGSIWLGLTRQVRSTRAYPRVEEIRRMVSRSAYAELRYSPLILVGTVAGLALTYLFPPLMALFAHGAAQTLGVFTWLVMAIAFQPTLRFYRLSPLWGFALPAIALAFLIYTLDSAWQHSRGQGGMWKGRAQAARPR